MDSDDPLIVVDDVEATEMQAGPSTAAYDQSMSAFSSDALPRPMSVAEYSMASSGRSTRSFSNPPVQRSTEASDRTTRSSTAKYKPQPKLKLKLSEKAAAQAPGMSFLGQYDRELDSDDEDLAFEEQFILRMPPGEDLEKLRKMVAAREVTNEVWFKFKGVSQTSALELLLHSLCRLSSCSFPHWHLYIFSKIGRSSLHCGVAKDTGQQANVQSCGYMPGRRFLHPM